MHGGESMSSIKLKHSSGNSMSIEAPATNPASDLALKLPATVGSTNQVLKNSGTAGTLEFGNKGRILQIVTGETNSRVGTSSTSYQDSNCSASISLSNANNNVIVILSGDVQQSNGSMIYVTVFRGGTGGTDIGNGSSGLISVWGADNMVIPCTCMVRDTGINTTSSTEYLVKYKRGETNANVFLPGNSGGNKFFIHLLEEEV